MDDGDLSGYSALDPPASTFLDPLPALIAGVEPIELPVAPDYSEAYQFEALEDGWHQAVYGFPDQAADVAAALFPPTVIEPVETFAAQPHFGDWQDWQAVEETQDYQQDPSLDVSGVLAPNETKNNTFEGG